jgi:hypothetical protein
MVISNTSIPTPHSPEIFGAGLALTTRQIDIDGSEGSIPLDLNYDAAPQEVKGKYDFVTNFGTTEHVANQLNAFEIIHDLTSPGSLMVHALPAQGMLNHGLINYNFKFFWMLARSNDYKIVHADFLHSQEFYGLPDYMIDFLRAASLRAETAWESARVADAFIVIAMQLPLCRRSMCRRGHALASRS